MCFLNKRENACMFPIKPPKKLGNAHMFCIPRGPCYFCVSLCFQKTKKIPLYFQARHRYAVEFPLGKSGDCSDMAMDSAVETVPVESSTAEAAATPTAANAAVTDGQGNNVKMVKCRRCAASVADTLVTQKFREDLRYTCRPCHAVQTQLQRHGVDLKTVLSEEDVATFFLDAKAERDNTLDKRLCYAQARGILKKRMVESSMKVDREGEEAEYQPFVLLGTEGLQHATHSRAMRGQERASFARHMLRCQHFQEVVRARTAGRGRTFAHVRVAC